MSTHPDGKLYSIHEIWPTPNLERTFNSWQRLQKLAADGELTIDGYSLDIATLVALSKYGAAPSIAVKDDIRKRMEDSVNTLNDYLSKGYYVYGVTTGFGGSANSRTKDLKGLQRALLQHTQSAVLTSADKDANGVFTESLGPHSMPTAWTRATMLIRTNTNIRGHSAVTHNLVDTIIELLRIGITPVIPLRGSISASGDLMPLSYIAGAVQGNPDIFVRVPADGGKQARVIPAQQALEEAGIAPIILGPKEGLGLINGTAASAAVASLALHEAKQLGVLAQLLTAINCESLASNTEWAHPFIAAVRPHTGQIEVAQNIRNFLAGSKLTHGLETTKDRFKRGLAQDRYALRSASQWIGPYLEDLDSAEKQLITELNSTTDNPIVNAGDNDIHSCANFQAVTVTSATEKTRLACQMFGKMIFAQTSEIINSDLSNGLPCNLAADDPSLSFCLKGLDVNMAAYMSELAFLANPVSSHVQSAEMHNQAVNSLALLSARYTMQAVETLSLLVAGDIYAACQGADLRVMHTTFLHDFKRRAYEVFSNGLSSHAQVVTDMFSVFWTAACEKWYATADLDAHERCEAAAATLSTVFSASASTPAELSVVSIGQLQKTLESSMLQSYKSHRAAFFKEPTTPAYLGTGTRRLYMFVRETLQVPMHQGLIEHPMPQDPAGNMLDGRPKRTIGSWISIIYEAVRDGRVFDDVMRGIEKARPLKMGANGHVNGHANGNGVTNGNGYGNGNGHNFSHGLDQEASHATAAAQTSQME